MASKNKRKQTFKEDYSRSWDFIKPSRKGENHARCTLSSADFSIAASGRYDITQHIATAKHRNLPVVRHKMYYNACYKDASYKMR